MDYRLPRHPVSAKQSIVLTGLGADVFDQCARGILEVHSKLSSVLPADTLQTWKPITDKGHICLEFGNRYFAGESEGADLEDLGVSNIIDPLGILTREVPHGKHTEDNVVLYFDRVPDSKQG